MSRDESGYEEPMMKIYNLVKTNDPLYQIFVELLPEKFT